MRAAVYARKSNDDAAGTERQVELARDFATARGWTVEAAHVFTDNDVSGGVFDRPGLNALLATVEQRPRPFDALVMMESSRLGREMAQTLVLQLRITAAGVRVFHYQDGQELLVSTPTQKLVAQVNAFGAEDYRHQIGLKTSAALRKHAEKGWLTGNAPFGYDVVPVDGHKELRVNETQATIVRQMFAWAAEGAGINRLAARLNAEHPGLRKWSGPSVRDMLSNPTYIGQLVHGRRSRPPGTTRRMANALPPIVAERPELRIVPDSLWRQVEERRAMMFKTYARSAGGRLTGRPEMTSGKFLLTGFVTCGVCGGRMVITSSRPTTPKFLACWRAKSRGASACGNLRTVRLDELTTAIVHALKKDVLTPERVAQVRRDLAADAEQAPEKAAARRATLEAEVRRLEGRLAKLTDAVAEGGNLPSLLAALQAAEGDKRAAVARLAALDSAQKAVAEWSTRGEDHRVQTLLGSWQEALEGDPAVGRQVLRKLLVGPIVVTPETDGTIRYRAEGSFSRLLIGTLGAELESVTVKPRGMANKADLSRELVALATDRPGGEPGGRADGRGTPG